MRRRTWSLVPGVLLPLLPLATSAAGAAPDSGTDAGLSAAQDELPALSVTVSPLPTMPRPEVRPDLSAPPLDAALRGLSPRIDGIFEGAWKRGTPAEGLRSLANKGPPHPDWSVVAWVSDTDLVLALGQVSEQADVVVTIDPDASRRGWVRVHLSEGQAVLEDCRATPDDATMPVHHAWSVATWDCGPPLPADAAHGEDGWEIALPWTTLGPTTDDLQVNVRITDGDYSLSLEPGGGHRDYTPRGRTLDRRGVPARRDVLTPGWNRLDNTLTATLRASAEEPEVWRWSVVFAGREEAFGHVRVSAETPTASFSVPDLEPSGWVYLLARRVGTEPLAPGAWRHIWAVGERGTLSTPVFSDALIARVKQDVPLKETPVQVRDSRGRLLGEARVDLPRGLSSLRIEASEDWPDLVEVRVGDRFVEGWLPAVRAGSTRKQLGRP